VVRGPTILVIDDERASRIVLRRIFAGAGYQFFDASTGAQALERMSEGICDLIVLDPALADMDGFDLIRAIRHRSAKPIIVLSASNDECAKVRAFDLGVDDYVTKPFSEKELLARLRTAFRHRFQGKGEQSRVVSGDLEVDLVQRTVRVHGRLVLLTRLEYRLLSILVRHAGRVLTYPELTSQIWGESVPRSLRPLRMIIRGLRRKTEMDPARPAHIITETRIGYRLAVRQRAVVPAATAGWGRGVLRIF
jgi:two-component system KDP operon response regulator KdpE